MRKTPKEKRTEAVEAVESMGVTKEWSIGEKWEGGPKTKPEGYVFGRPTKYEGQRTVDFAYKYVAECVPEYGEFHSTRGEKSDTYQRLLRVKWPTREGLAIRLGVLKETMIEWAKVHPDFSDALDFLDQSQKEQITQTTANGEASQVIGKLMLSVNHGMREVTTLAGDKNNPLFPQPIYGGKAE